MNQQLKQKIKIEALKYVAHIPLQTTILVCGGLVSYGQQAEANHDMGNWLAYGALVGALQGVVLPISACMRVKNPFFGPVAWVLLAFLSIPVGGLMLDCPELVGVALMSEVVGLAVLMALMVLCLFCFNMGVLCKNVKNANQLAIDDVNRMAVMIELPVASPVVVLTDSEPQRVPSQISLFQPAVDQTEIEQERPVAYAVMVPHST